ncbi:MAG: hypothetical protein Q9210_000583 [Variospora velana]
MAYPQTYIPHPDLDPAQPPYSFTPSYPAANFSQPRHPLQAQHFHHAPNQQYGLPNQAHGHGPPSSMPPPSFYRQNYPYGSEPRAPDRWPLGITDDQRQQSGPVSSFPTPPQNRSPPQNQPPQTPQNFRSPPAAAQKSQPPMTAAAVKAVPPSNPTPSTLPADAVKSATSSRVSPTLEAQRVSTLLELNRVLLQEVVKDQAVQNAQKAASNPSQLQSNPLQTNPSSTADASKAADTHTQSDTTGASSATKKETDATAEDSKIAPSSTNRATPQQQQPPNKVLHTKEYVEYMRRLQANLAYLASVADRNHKPGNAVPLFPAIMEAPVLPPPAATKVKQQQQKDNAEQEGAVDARETIKQLYGKIKDLWPEYKGPGTAASGGAPPTQARQMATSAA